MAKQVDPIQVTKLLSHMGAPFGTYPNEKKRHILTFGSHNGSGSSSGVKKNQQNTNSSKWEKTSSKQILE